MGGRSIFKPVANFQKQLQKQTSNLISKALFGWLKKRLIIMLIYCERKTLLFR